MEPPGVGPPGSNAAISITGIAANDAAEGETGGAATDARRVAADDDPGAIAAGAHAAISITGAGRRSLCEPLRVVIEAKLQQGLTSQRIWQDLKAEHGFRDGYQSVQRFIRG